MADLEGLTRQRRQAGERLKELGSTVFDAFLKMEQAAFVDGALTRKSKELVAVGIAVAQGCDSCIQWHIEHAARHGASEREVLEAVEVAMEMGGGQATVHARTALEVMDAVFHNGTGG